MHSTSYFSPQIPPQPEQNLWCAVVEQALADIGAIKESRGVRHCPPSPFSKEYNDAVRWLLYDKQDFSFVCMMAGISPSVIRLAAKTAKQY